MLMSAFEIQEKEFHNIPRHQGRCLSSKGHFGSSDLTVFVEELVKRAQNGVLVIADAGPFFHLNKRDKLIEHELSMPSQFDVNLKRFCIFHKQDFKMLTEEQQQKLVSHHGQVLMIEER